jgi:hypothetical protein
VIAMTYIDNEVFDHALEQRQILAVHFVELQRVLLRLAAHGRPREDFRFQKDVAVLFRKAFEGLLHLVGHAKVLHLKQQ